MNDWYSMAGSYVCCADEDGADAGAVGCDDSGVG
jgi:hypothetical protein